MNNPLFVAGIIMLVLVAPALVYICYRLVSYQKGVTENGVQITGVIRRVATANQGPIIRYVTKEGQEYTLQYPFYSPKMRGKYTVLEEVSITYDHKHPKHYLLAEEKTLKRMILLTLVGIVVTISFGIIIMFL